MTLGQFGSQNAQPGRLVYGSNLGSQVIPSVATASLSFASSSIGIAAFKATAPALLSISETAASRSIEQSAATISLASSGAGSPSLPLRASAGITLASGGVPKYIDTASASLALSEAIAPSVSNNIALASLAISSSAVAVYINYTYQTPYDTAVYDVSTYDFLFNKAVASLSLDTIATGVSVLSGSATGSVSILGVGTDRSNESAFSIISLTASAAGSPSVSAVASGTFSLASGGIPRYIDAGVALLALSEGPSQGVSNELATASLALLSSSVPSVLGIALSILTYNAVSTGMAVSNALASLVLSSLIAPSTSEISGTGNALLNLSEGLVLDVSNEFALASLGLVSVAVPKISLRASTSLIYGSNATSVSHISNAASAVFDLEIGPADVSGSGVALGILGFDAIGTDISIELSTSTLDFVASAAGGPGFGSVGLASLDYSSDAAVSVKFDFLVTHLDFTSIATGVVSISSGGDATLRYFSSSTVITFSRSLARLSFGGMGLGEPAFSGFAYGAVSFWQKTVGSPGTYGFGSGALSFISRGRDQSVEQAVAQLSLTESSKIQSPSVLAQLTLISLANVQVGIRGIRQQLSITARSDLSITVIGGTLVVLAVARILTDSNLYILNGNVATSSNLYILGPTSQLGNVAVLV